MFKLPREKFKEIILKTMEKEMQKKLKLVLMIPFLRDQLPMMLIPLANILTTQKYKMGEYILRKGEHIHCLGIVAKGECQVIDEMRQQRDMINLLIKPKPKFFKYKNHCQPDTTMDGNNESYHNNQIESSFYFPKELREDRTFHNTQKVKIGSRFE